MADEEILRETTIVERPVRGRRTVVERREGVGWGFNPFAGLVLAVVTILLLLLILGVLV